VEEGRGIFDNIRKTIYFLLSCNISEVLVMLFAALIGLPLPLLPIQILWMNLVTDGFPALALAVDPKSPDLMKQPPRRPEARLLDGGTLLAIGAQGVMLGAISLGAFAYSLYGLHQEVEQARTVAFTVMVVAQLVHAFNCRSERLSLFQVGSMDQSSAPLGLFTLSWDSGCRYHHSSCRVDLQGCPGADRRLGINGSHGISAVPPDGTDKGATTLMKVLANDRRGRTGSVA